MNEVRTFFILLDNSIKVESIMIKTYQTFILALIATNVSAQLTTNLNNKKPNVIILYFDDMGYGDLGANGKTALKIPKDCKFLNPNKKTLTPNLDKFASEIMRFTNGHSSDGVCSPSRYSLVTGKYSWRTSLKRGVTGGYSPTFMDADTFTIGTLFQNVGYKTAMIGKWHIGMTFFDSEGKPYSHKGNDPNAMANGYVDFSKEVKDTPAHRGFDYWFGTPASLDMPPYAWLESKNGKVNVLYKGAIVTNDKVDFSQAQIATNSNFVVFQKNEGVHARGGAKDPSFVFEDYLQIQAQKVKNLIHTYQQENVPFMMYIPMPAPHEPHAVQDKFKGSTGYEYGDYLVQTDFYAGQIIEALGDPSDPNSLASNTVVLITSDNGPEQGAFYRSLKLNHDANGPWAGIKRDNYEGGTRVPFMVRWPTIANPGITNEVCLQGDIVATMASYLKYELTEEQAPDSESFLSILKGKRKPKKGRTGIVEHSSRGQFAFVDKKGEWKLMDGTGGGGNKTTVDANNNKILKFGELRGKPRQLFNLKKDPGETDNLLIDDPQNPNDNNDPTKAALQKEIELYEHLNHIRGDKMFGSELVEKIN